VELDTTFKHNELIGKVSNSQKTQPLISPTMNFTELREPLDLIDTDN